MLAEVLYFFFIIYIVFYFVIISHLFLVEATYIKDIDTDA